jgi:hypothetical protein
MYYCHVQMGCGACIVVSRDTSTQSRAPLIGGRSLIRLVISVPHYCDCELRKLEASYSDRELCSVHLRHYDRLTLQAQIYALHTTQPCLLEQSSYMTINYYS